MYHAAVKLAVLVMTLCASTTLVVAEDFRIETKVYSGKSKNPISQNTTLFRAGYVYDYLSSSASRVVVFDQRGGRFVLLDPVKKVKAELKTDDVRVLMDKLHDLAAKSSHPSMKFAADPQFEVDLTEDGELTLSSQHMTYKLQTVAAPSDFAMQQYRDFSDWYARFNTMANPGSTPPFPRLKVNAELAKRGLVPTEVQLNTRDMTARTEHYVTWRLLDSDQKRLAETENQLATFEEVDLKTFLVPPSGSLSRR